MNKLERMTDVKRSMIAKAIAAFMSIALALTMTNVSLFASYAWATGDGQSVENTEGTPEGTLEEGTPNPDGSGDGTPAVIDEEDSGKNEPAVEKTEDAPGVEEEAPAFVEPQGNASVLMVAEETIMFEPLAIAPMGLLDGKELKPNVTKNWNVTVKCGEPSELICKTEPLEGINHVVGTVTCHWGTEPENANVIVTPGEMNYSQASATVVVKNVDNAKVVHKVDGGLGLTERHLVTYTLTVKHNYVDVEAKEPTCTEPGNTKGQKCTTCDRTTVKPIPATGHNTEGVVEHKDATCTETGVVGGTYCTVCNHGKEAAEAIIEKLEHNTEGVVEHKDATCTETGVVGGTYCTVCGKGEADAKAAIPTLGHDLKVTATAPSSCTNQGYVFKECTRCDYTESEDLPLDGSAHKTVDVIGYAATCTTTGLTDGSYCAHCGKVLVAQTSIPATGHTVVTDEAVAPTCTEAGLTEGSHCSVCNEVLVAQETVDALGHDMITDEGVPATCETDGLTEGAHCSRCDAATTAQQVIPATGHVYGEWTVVTPATVDAEGLEQRVCANDPAHIETRTIDRLPAPVVPDNQPDGTTPGGIDNPTGDTTPGGDGGTTGGAGTIPTTPDTTVIPDAPTPLAATPAATPAAPAAEAIADDANPLAATPGEETIDDEGNPLASFELEPQCWVHWLMLLGIIVTLFYGLGVVVNRRKDIQAMDEVEAELTGKRLQQRGIAHRSQEI